MPRQLPGPAHLQRGEGDSGSRAEGRGEPEHAPRTLPGAHHNDNRCRRGQQRDDDRAVACGARRERQRGQQWEPDDNAQRDDREAQPLGEAWKPLPSDSEGEHREHTRDDGAGRGDEER